MISEKKWNSFNITKKIKFFEDFYFRLEKLFSKETYDIEIEELQCYTKFHQGGDANGRPKHHKCSENRHISDED